MAKFQQDENGAKIDKYTDEYAKKQFLHPEVCEKDASGNYTSDSALGQLINIAAAKFKKNKKTFLTSKENLLLIQQFLEGLRNNSNRGLKTLLGIGKYEPVYKEANKLINKYMKGQEDVDVSEKVKIALGKLIEDAKADITFVDEMMKKLSKYFVNKKIRNELRGNILIDFCEKVLIVRFARILKYLSYEFAKLPNKVNAYRMAKCDVDGKVEFIRTLYDEGGVSSNDLKLAQKYLKKYEKNLEEIKEKFEFYRELQKLGDDIYNLMKNTEMSFKIITEVLPQKMNGTFKEQLTVYQRTVNLFEEAFENAKKAMQSYEEKLKNIKIPEKYNNKMEDVTDNGSLNTSTDGQVDDKKEVKPATESKTEENADTEADKSDISAINAASLQDAIKKLKKVDDKEEVKPATESKTEENADTEADKSDISAINAASLQDAMKKLKKVEVKVDDKKEVKPATEQRTGGNVSLQDSLQDAMKKLKKVEVKNDENKNPLKKKITGPFEAKILQEVAEKMEATQQSDDEGNSTSDSEEESSEW